MKVYGLFGKSGTGKSYQATELCRRIGIAGILDDGLFISGNSILAGVSAKRQETKVRAIKTALFSDDAHCEAVAAKLREVAPESVLVIGTSERMVRMIAARLGLPAPAELIDIETITTAAERRTAGTQRHRYGKHIIPAPTVQLKKDFSGYFLHPLSLLAGRRREGAKDRSVVRPTYSYAGHYRISSRAIGEIALIAGRETRDVKAVLRVTVDRGDAGVAVSLSVHIAYGVRVREAAERLQRHIAQRLETMTAFNVHAVNIDVKGLR